MTDKINQLKQKAIEEFEKRFITFVNWGFNFNMKDFEIFMHFYQDELEKVVREEIIREIDKVYKDERGINNWLDLREKILPPKLKNKRGKSFVPDKEAMIFGTKKWDGHTLTPTQNFKIGEWQTTGKPVWNKTTIWQKIVKKIKNIWRKKENTIF